MIARARRFFHRRRAFGEQTGEQQARLHLRAGHRHCVLDAIQAACRWIISGAWSSVALISAPIFRSGSITRFIGRRDSDSSPINLAAERLSRDDAAQHPHGRAGVPAVELSRRRFQLRADAVNDDRAFLVALDRAPQRAYALPACCCSRHRESSSRNASARAPAPPASHNGAKSTCLPARAGFPECCAPDGL